MKKRVLWSLLLVVALLAIATPAALAYGSVTGQVNDGYGAAWTHGGTVSCTSTADGSSLGTGSIASNGSWSVTLSARNVAATCTIDPAAGTGGDPAAFTCPVEGTNSNNTLSCPTTNIPNGPNAVTLASFSGSQIAPAWLLAPIGLAAAVFAWVRGR
jgi:hypothetical protein